MAEAKETEIRKERAYLLGIIEPQGDAKVAESLLHELIGLAETLQLEQAGVQMIKMRERHAALLLGTGKADEIVALAKAASADSILFDIPLTPTQQRNWEELSGLSVYDRHELILRIFASRAQTKEAVMQVELARLQYSLPRLAHSYEALSRQRGGRFGNKGSGEQKLELDRREIQLRINKIKKDLEVVEKEREVQRKRRERTETPQAAIVGYTNSGKSSLLNTITQASVVAEDKLFATLDTTTRRLEFTPGRPLLVTDTVGFIRNLPHGLVNAFKSTLEEASRADLLVHVLDANDVDIDVQYELTKEVLKDLGADAIPCLIVLNKIDLVESELERSRLLAHFEGAITVSALSGEGVSVLVKEVEKRLLQAHAEKTFHIPASRYDLVSLVYREGQVIKEDHTEAGIVLVAQVDERLYAKLKEFEAEKELLTD